MLCFTILRCLDSKAKQEISPAFALYYMLKNEFSRPAIIG